MRFTCVVLSLLLPLIMSSASVRGAEISGYTLPDSLQQFDEEYRLFGCGLRELLFSDIYLLGLYLRPGDSASDNTVDIGKSRIFRLQVLYKGDLPEDLPELWKAPLEEELSKEYLAILQDLYDAVDNGDTVEFSFHPEQGEILAINGDIQLRKSTVALVPALTRLWLGEEPVSGNLKRLLVNGDCR